MKRFMQIAAFVCILAANAALAAGGLDGFLDSLNAQARADRNGFTVKLAAQFGVPQAQVETIIHTVSAPADAFMCLQLGQMTSRPPTQVVQVYQSNRGKGWGVIAKQLGIKPGSKEFHALKRGDFQFTGQPSQGPGEGHGKGHGKGKGKGHGRED